MLPNIRLYLYMVEDSVLHLPESVLNLVYGGHRWIQVLWHSEQNASSPEQKAQKFINWKNNNYIFWHF